MMIAVLLLGTCVVLGQTGIVVDGNKVSFCGTLTGPNDGCFPIGSYANSDNGRPTNDADFSAQVWASWDQDWFYVYTEATDGTQTGGSILDMRLSAPFAETGGVVAPSLRSCTAAADKKSASH